jgi:hypothetical protein
MCFLLGPAQNYIGRHCDGNIQWWCRLCVIITSSCNCVILQPASILQVLLCITYGYNKYLYNSAITDCPYIHTTSHLLGPRQYNTNNGQRSATRSPSAVHNAVTEFTSRTAYWTRTARTKWHKPTQLRHYK